MTMMLNDWSNLYQHEAIDSTKSKENTRPIDSNTSDEMNMFIDNESLDMCKTILSTSICSYDLHFVGKFSST